MVENIKQMRERHKLEIQILQESCNHENVSDCMPFAWVPGHFSHCVKICEICGKELFTTFKGTPIWDEKGKMTLLDATPEEKLFECPKRMDCFLTKQVEEADAHDD